MQVESLRAALHEAIDRVIDSYLGDSALASSHIEVDATDERIEVVTGEVHGPFTFRWPSGNEETFTRSQWYTVRDRDREHRALVAWTEREAWGRQRERAVIFRVSGSSRYPLSEFAATDDGRFAAAIPDPDHPRALLKQGDPIPDSFRSDTVERTDQLFHGIRRGPSLRLVVGPEDEQRMVRHAHWVAGLRGRL